MASRLRFLPQGKRDELAFVVDMIRSGFAHATAQRNSPALKDARLLRIVLFGSYARDEWVEDPIGRYFSDYDLLVVVDRNEATDYADFWERIDKRLIHAVSAGTHLRTPVSLIVHTLADVNEKLRLGRYFFIDIVRDGIVLFEEEGAAFAEPQPLSPAQALVETRDYFEEWFESAGRFLSNALDNASKGWNNEAAFLMHQAAERFYHCLFLTMTLYSPKTHALSKLREMAEALEPRLREVWPNASKAEKRCYALLRDAYVKARYSREYRITPEQLRWLSERVRLLRQLVEQACRERLATLEIAA